MVQKIKEEIFQEEEERRDRKNKEVRRMQEIMNENDENQRRLKNEAEREKQEVHFSSIIGYRDAKGICPLARRIGE